MKEVNHQQNIQQYLKNINEDVPAIRSNEIINYIEWWHTEPIHIIYTTLDNEVFTQSYKVDMKISEVKEVLQNVYSIDKSLIVLSMHNKELDEQKRLQDFNSDFHKCLHFNLKSKNPSRFISGKHPYKDITVPDVIKVKVTYDNGKTEQLNVEIHNQNILKPFIGGYKNNITNIEYHNGYTQTGHITQTKNKTSHRDTQTYILKNRKLQTKHSISTQMSNSKIYIPNVNDRIIKAKPYITAEKHAAQLNIEGKVRIIQRYTRAWILKKRLKSWHEEYCKRIRLENEDEEYVNRMNSKRKLCELIGKIYPQTKSDFYMLYTMLKKWKQAETDYIKLTTCGPARIAEMYLLLEKEIQMLLAIEKQKKIVENDKKILKNYKFLKSISEPVSWNSNYKNLYIEMDTIETQNGRKYLEFYTKLCDHNITCKNKLDLYIEIKLSLKNHINCRLGIVLAKLCDRMCKLISHGISEKHLIELEKRIEACYIKHLRFEKCSKGVSHRLLKTTEEKMRNNLLYCNRCNKFKTEDKFYIGCTTIKAHVCNNCSWNDRVLEPWIDIKPYSYILQCIRREERRFSAVSSVAFILTDKDIYHIVTEIWKSHSAINEVNDIYKLRLCRFFKEFDWAPWNCILLTYEEAKVHSNIRNIDEVYAKEFLTMVYENHVVAKHKYNAAIELDAYFQEIGKVDTRWNELKPSKKYVALNKTTHLLKCH